MKQPPIVLLCLMRVIGLAAKFESGKDTFYKLLKHRLEDKGFIVYRIAFADELKRELADALGVSFEWIDEHKADPAVRKLLQLWGTDIRRAYFGSSYWTSKAIPKIKLLLEDPLSVVVVTDVRFMDESSALRSCFGALIVGLSSPPSVQQDAATTQHVSEVELERIHKNVELVNHRRGLEEFSAAIHQAITEPYFSAHYPKP